MISLFQRVLVLFVCLARGEVDAEMTNRTTASGCPSFTEIPVASMHPGQPERDWFYSGRHYGGLGHEIPALACNDDGGPWDDGYNVMYPDVQGTFGSIMVNPGCTFYFFQKPNYEGKHVEYYGGHKGLLVSKVPVPSWAEHACPQFPSTELLCVRSYLTSCEQTFPNCAPKDGWQPITCLDNTGSDHEVPFTFKQTIGTTWSSEVSSSMSVSERVEASISKNFFGIFDASLGYSQETGMNWGTVSTYEKSETHEYEVGPIVVPGGSIVCIEGAIGSCGDSTVQTHIYRVISGETGEVLSIGRTLI